MAYVCYRLDYSNNEETMLHYDQRIQTNHPFDYCRVYDDPKDPKLAEFTRVIWFGYDEEGPAVYRENPSTGKIVRLDFLKS
ncbi:MAG: hypothetical protein AB7C91_04155 [Sphaerochaeta sp.]|uniref:hypothetical protein n=1 Tax=Sphaerochaeta sp. TaxID=1972642 RepID=UPI002FCBD64A